MSTEFVNLVAMYAMKHDGSRMSLWAGPPEWRSRKPLPESGGSIMNTAKVPLSRPGLFPLLA